MSEEIIHMSCMGTLCDNTIHIGKNYEKPKVTLRPLDVTCPECIKKLKEMKIIK